MFGTLGYGLRLAEGNSQVTTLGEKPVGRQVPARGQETGETSHPANPSFDDIALTDGISL